MRFLTSARALGALSALVGLTATAATPAPAAPAPETAPETVVVRVDAQGNQAYLTTETADLSTEAGRAAVAANRGFRPVANRELHADTGGDVPSAYNQAPQTAYRWGCGYCGWGFWPRVYAPPVAYVPWAPAQFVSPVWYQPPPPPVWYNPAPTVWYDPTPAAWYPYQPAIAWPVFYASARVEFYAYRRVYRW